MRRKTLFSDAT